MSRPPHRGAQKLARIRQSNARLSSTAEAAEAEQTPGRIVNCDDATRGEPPTSADPKILPEYHCDVTARMPRVSGA